MQLIDKDDVAEFEDILRKFRLARSDFSLSATDTTDPKTDEISALQGELTVRRTSTGSVKQYRISDSSAWLELFRNDIIGGAFADQDSLDVRALDKQRS